MEAIFCAKLEGPRLSRTCTSLGHKRCLANTKQNSEVVLLTKATASQGLRALSLIHISEPTRPRLI
eukprot:3919634-Amphidinium_carterae.1